MSQPTPVRHSGIVQDRRAVLAASAGNLLEWFDFSVYALFAVYVGANFFPRGNPGADLVKAFLVFGLGFVARPLGSIIIGNYGDRAGRKAALTLTVLLMGVGTLIIAATPSYASIGLAAPILLLAGRLMQGFSAGGEIGSAAAFLVEYAPNRGRGRVSSWLQASMGMSNILGALVGFAATSLLSLAALTDWGWRIPFCAGLLIVPYGLYLRRSLRETPEFTDEAARRGAATPAPVVAVLREGAPDLLRGFGISILWAVAVYVLLIFMPVFVQGAFGFTANQAFRASMIENMLFVAGCFATGSLADRIGAARMLGIGALGLLLGVPPLFLWLDAHRSVPALILVMSILGVLVAAFTGVAPLVLAGMFRTGLRSTGISLAYNGAFVIFGGFAPAILTWFTTIARGSVFAPAWYVALAALPALAALGSLHRNQGGSGAAEAAKLALREFP